MLQRFEQFTFAISDISRSIQKIERDEMEKLGLKGAYAQYLLVMDRYPEGITASALCELCDRDKAAVSRILSELEAKALTERAPGSVGPYRSPIRLTAKGRDAARFIRERSEIAVKIAGDGLTDSDRTVLYAALERIASNLHGICTGGIPDSYPNQNIKGEPIMKVRIVIDSTADTPAAVREKCSVVPLTIHFGDEDFADGVTITHQEFYKRLVEGKALPSTSQPTPAAFAEVFQSAVDAGEEVVVVTISSKLSGTYQSASIAAMDFPGKVFVVDSMNAALATGVLAEFGIQLAEQGMSAAEIAERLTAERNNVRLVAVVDTLEYLKRGGRVSKTVAFAGELLSIKPVIAIENGEVAVIGKVRGTKQAHNALNKDLQAGSGVDFTKPFLLGYTGTDRTALDSYMSENAHIWAGHEDALNTTIVGSVIGTHAGPGAIAVGFFKNNG